MAESGLLRSTHARFPSLPVNKETMVLKRITTDPAACGGRPCVRGLRFPVSRLLGLLAAGERPEAILAAYDYLEPEDISEALNYAALLADEQVIDVSS